MAVKKTSLSVGARVRALLLADAEVRKRTNKVFPIVVDKAELPYILYRRAALKHDPTKAGAPGADTVQLEVVCYTAKYAEGVELAEAVRGALDYARGGDEPHIRSCILADSEEGYEDDAFAQRMVFEVRC